MLVKKKTCHLEIKNDTKGKIFKGKKNLEDNFLKGNLQARELAQSIKCLTCKYRNLNLTPELRRKKVRLGGAHL